MFQSSDAVAHATAITTLCLQKWRRLILILPVLIFSSLALQAQEDITKLSNPVNLEQKKITVASLLDMLGQQTGYSFFYDKDELNAFKNRDWSFRETTLGKVLHSLQSSHNMVFKLSGKNIAVRVERRLAADSTLLPGRLAGTILDAETGEPVNGATVQIGTKNLISNIDGEFLINLPAGKHSVQVSFVGYEAKKIAEIQIHGGATSSAEILLNRLKGNLSTVTVRTSIKKDGVNALLLKQKNNAAISDGISAEQIGRTPDKNIGEVLRRVSGLSTMDNKYVVVRGLSERYNGAMLNGQTLPSTELNRKNFNYEMIPANMVENVIVNKSITPDMSAEFGGGLVQVNTRSVPTSDFFSVTGGMSVNEKTTGKVFLSQLLDNRSYLGLITEDRNLLGKAKWSGYRALIKDGRLEPFGDEGAKFKNKNDLTNNWRLYKYRPLPSVNMQVSGGRVLALEKNRSLGLMASVSYRNNWQTQDVRMGRDGYGGKDSTGDNAGFAGTRYGFTSNLSGIVLAGYSSPHTKLSIQSLYLGMLDQQFTLGLGFRDNTGRSVGYFDITQQTSMWQHQLKGEHLLNRKGLKLSYAGSYLFLDKEKPDNHIFNANYIGTGKDIPGKDADFTISAPEVRGGNALRTWNRAYEKNLSWNTDLTVPFNFKLFSLPFVNSFKTGYAGWHKDRHFFIVNVNSIGGGPKGEMPLTEYFEPQNLTGAGISRWGDEFPGKGQPGKTILHAGYMMIDQKISKKLRLVYGLRGEYLNLNYVNVALQKRFEKESKVLDYSELYNREPNLNWFPSLNLTYSLTKSINLRFAYAKSIVRPDVREMSYFKEYDFELGGSYGANDQVVSTKIHHYDLRFEWYPSAGELISVSYFYKKLLYPMEIFDLINHEFELRNDKDAVNQGIEIEFRKSFAFTGVKALKGLTLFGNFTRLFSKVRRMGNAYVIGADGRISLTEVVAESENRPQTGASNFIYNAGLYYDISPLSFSATWNYITNRTFRPSSTNAYSLFEQPVQSLDAQVSCKMLKKRGLLKLSLSNLLNSYYIVYMNNYLEDGYKNPSTKELLYQRGRDQIDYEAKPGRSASLTFTYNL
ncbi:TonB-dependent receptor [Pseudoflavitalea sp. G-6-1-2]|uniref:TonB-dependent receptor n=1 Tax=Pseudoflavitalea sp. G-6-1-2 TaxID=2728841 RepID=UPI00146B0AB6|nr:TonB-dependent receptor [Pseudoflavitalea sp. G-6-1-2]NML22943.1 TonB-dependent receptor [Pseudoflavitalea sp. G-6-1-2]